MKQIYLESYFKRGYRRLMQYVSNIAHLDKKVQEVVRESVKIIEFFDEFGLAATKRAFETGRSTIYLWKSNLKQSSGKLSSLAPKSKTPKTRSKRVWRQEIIDFIVRYRSEYHGADKVTIKPVLDAFCRSIGITAVSESTEESLSKDSSTSLGMTPNKKYGG